MSERSREDEGIKQGVLLRCRRQMAAAPDEAQTVASHHSWLRGKQEEGSATALGKVSAPPLFIPHIKPCLSAMHSPAGARPGLRAKHLRRGRAGQVMRHPGPGRRLLMVALQLPTACSRGSRLPAPCQHTPPAPSTARPAGRPPRAEGTECLQAPRYPAAELAVKPPFWAFCTGLRLKEEQRYTCHLLLLSSHPVPVRHPMEKQLKWHKNQEKTKY